jgi:hypothetical protein
MTEPPRSEDEALATFRQWLSSPSELGSEPDELAVVYRKKIAELGKVYLVRWAGVGLDAVPRDGVGFVGPVCWSFLDVPESLYATVKKKERWARTLNLYFGWYAAFLSRRGPKPVKAPDLASIDEAVGPAVHTHCKRLSYEERSAKTGQRRLVCYEPHELRAVEVARVGKRDYCVFEAKAPAMPEGFVALAVREAKARGRVKATFDFRLRGQVPELYQRLPLYHLIGTFEGPTEFTMGGKPALW